MANQFLASAGVAVIGEANLTRVPGSSLGARTLMSWGSLSSEAGHGIPN
jgi:hypothetical protein